MVCLFLSGSDCSWLLGGFPFRQQPEAEGFPLICVYMVWILFLQSFALSAGVMEI
jgi:hypothetical protein